MHASKCVCARVRALASGYTHTCVVSQALDAGLATKYPCMHRWRLALRTSRGFIANSFRSNFCLEASLGRCGRVRADG